MEIVQAEKRSCIGKSGARSLRKNGRVPAEIYGNNLSNFSVHIDYKLAEKLWGNSRRSNTLFKIECEGKVETVITKQVQYHPVTDRPLHIDFARASQSSTMNMLIPISYINAHKSPGIKLGGKLNIIMRKIELRTQVNSIPEFIEVDLGNTKIGSKLKLDCLVLPEGTEHTSKDMNLTIATVSGRGKKDSSEESEEVESSS